MVELNRFVDEVEQVRQALNLDLDNFYIRCPNGSHMALYDDQVVYFQGLIQFIRDVDTGRFWE